MVDPEEFIKHGLDTISALIDRREFATALRACEQLLGVNPYHRKARRMYEKLQALVDADIAAKVDADIDATMYLWDEKEFERLGDIYRKLYAYAPNHKRLRKMIEKLDSTLTGAQLRERDTVITAALEAINQMLAAERLSEAIGACNELLAYMPMDKEAQKLLAVAKARFIDRELTRNQQIVDGSDFERAVEFLDGLLAVDPQSEKVQQLKKQLQGHLTEQRTIENRMNINESVQRLKELFKHAEYEKVLQACDEIQHIDGKNIEAALYRAKAERNLEKESFRIVVKKMQDAVYRKELKELHAAHPELVLMV